MASATQRRFLKLSHYTSMGALCYPWQPFPKLPHVFYIKFDQNYTPLKMEADNNNRPSLYSLPYLTWAFNSGELKQCDQKLSFRYNNSS